MAKLTKETDLWFGTISATDMSVDNPTTITLPTKGKHVDSDIEFKLPDGRAIIGNDAAFNTEVTQSSNASVQLTGLTGASTYGITIVTPSASELSNYVHYTPTTIINPGGGGRVRTTVSTSGYAEAGTVINAEQLDSVNVDFTSMSIYQKVVTPTINITTNAISVVDSSNTFVNLRTDKTSNTSGMSVRGTGQVKVNSLSYTNEAGAIAAHTNTAIDTSSAPTQPYSTSTEYVTGANMSTGKHLKSMILYMIGHLL